MSILKMVTASVALALVAGFALSTVNGSSRSHGSIFSVTTYDHHMPVQVYGANEYGDSDYGAQYPWVQDKILVEPYKLATLTAVGSAVEQAATITWTFGTDVQFGSESQYQFIIPGDYSMVLSITDSETGSKTVSTVAVICAYGECLPPSGSLFYFLPRCPHVSTHDATCIPLLSLRLQ